MLAAEQPVASRAPRRRPRPAAARRSSRRPDRWLALTASTVRLISPIQRLHRRAARERQLARDQVDRLDAVGAFVDRGDARIAIVLRGAGLLDVAHAAVHLHAERGDLVADVGRERLGDRREQRGAFVRGLARRVVRAALRAVERDGGGVADRARGARERAHGEQHALDVGMRDDRARAGAARRVRGPACARAHRRAPAGSRARRWRRPAARPRGGPGSSW